MAKVHLVIFKVYSQGEERTRRNPVTFVKLGSAKVRIFLKKKESIEIYNMRVLYVIKTVTGNHELVFGAEDELGSLEGNHSSHFSLAATLKRFMIDSASSIAGLTSKENTGTPGVSSGAS